MTPTSRSLAFLRREGFTVAVVEKWIPKLNVRADLWHFGDVLAVHPVRREFLIVQTTSAANVSSRLTKARGCPELATWLRAGGLFEVHGWDQRNGRWAVRRVGVLARELEPIALAELPRNRRRDRHQPADLFAGLGE